MDRDEIRERFSPLLDGELSPEERAEVEAALSEDAELLRELDALKRVDQLYANLPLEKAPEGFEDGVRAALSPNTLQFTRARFMRRKLWPLLAAAAVFIVFGAIVVVQMNPKSTRTQLSSTMAESAMESAPGKMHRQATPAADEAVASPQAQSAAPSIQAESTPGRALTDTEAYPGPGAVSSGSSYLEKPAEKKAKSEISSEESIAGQPAAAGEATEKDHEKGLQSLGYVSRETPATQSAPPAASAEPPRERQIASAPPETGVMNGETSAAKRGAESEAGEALEMAPMRATAEAKEQKEAGRIFEKKNGDWIQQGYRDESLKSIQRNSPEWKQLVAKEAKLDDLPKLEGRIVFKLDDTWYELLPLERSSS